MNGIQPGVRLRCSLWVQLWTSDAAAQPPTSLLEPGNLEARVCLDLDGCWPASNEATFST